MKPQQIWRTVLAAVGFAISAYLTAVHYDAHVPLACSSNGIIDCARVITSPQSVVFGLPLAVWGMLWFALLAVVVLIRARGAAWGGTADSVWAGVGALSIIYFVYLELFVVGRICIWCSAVHVLVLINLFVALSPGPAQVPPAGRR